MSLRLRQTVAGQPSAKSRHGVATITVDGVALVAYTSASNIVLLDHQLGLVHTLPFWSALPYRSASSSKQEVEGVITNQQHKLIIAWSATHAVVWQYRIQRDTGNWIAHSTLVLSAPITCIDYKAGILICGTSSGLELWRHDTKSSVVVWDRVWERQMPAPDTIIISPASGHIACFAKSERCVRVLTISSKGDLSGMPQEMRHPREIDWIGWRRPRSLTSGDAHLYTITINSVMRIYAPVLDDPAWFQLHSTLDGRAFLPKPLQSASGRGVNGKIPDVDPKGTIWPLEADIVREAIKVALEQDEQEKKPGVEVRRMMEALLAEETDVVAWIGEDGSLSLRSIVNMDRKPPTLLKTLPLARMTITRTYQQKASTPRYLHIPDSPVILAVPSPSPQQPLIRPVQLSLPHLLAGIPAGYTLIDPFTSDESTQVQLSSPISSFVRTPNGRGLLAMTESGEVGVWAKKQRGKPIRGVKHMKTLLGRGSWTEDDKPELSAIYAKGRAIVTFTSGSGEKKPGIWLRHLDSGNSKPTTPIPLPDFELPEDETVKMLMAVSDIDDGHSGEGRKTQQGYVMAASDGGTAWVWRVTSRRIASDGTDDLGPTRTEQVNKTDVPDIHLMTRYHLPIDDHVRTEGSKQKPGKPKLILPVDPMGWHQSVVDWNTNTPLQDIILTVSDAGVLEFWRPTFHKGSIEALPNGTAATSFGLKQHTHDAAWTRTGVVHTGKKGITMARCSSTKKTVLVCSGKEGEQEMTIWDSKVSEFSTGLELTEIYGKDDIIQDLDWTTTSDLQSVLAVGFAHKVELVCEQRMSYADDTPGWATFITIDLTRYTSVPIDDSIWLAGGSLAVGCGNQVYLFSRFLDRESPVPTPRSVSTHQEEPEDVFELIAHQNGPLLDYHPTVLAQCLLWNKIDLVKDILVNLRQSMRTAEEDGRKRVRYSRMDPMDFTKRTEPIKPAPKSGSKHGFLFDTAPDISPEDDSNTDFTETTVSDLIDRLSPDHEGGVQIPLTFSEKSMLATIARATLEVEAQRRALDICGLRYLISLRMFVNSSRRSPLSGTATPGSSSSSLKPQQRLSFRNIVWATHSESQDMLLKAAEEGCEGGKMIWADAKRLGVFLWLKSAETAKAQLEILARNRFMMGESRDPTCCSLIFFALGKKKVVHGLWRQAPGHKEQNLMLKFLANDFELERWKTAAAKNAYALLSKQRYEYAAAFFMLSGSPKDAITIILRQLDDWQLAFALARVVENGTDGPLIKWILSDTVVPLAIGGGHRWLATWAFWMLGRRDLAVRVLIAPMGDVAADWSSESLPVGNPENDDPSLLLLFQYLKSKSLQTAKGTSEIKGKTEFDFVLHNARVFCRMGCHPLALDLLRSWSFDRPFFPAPKARSKPLTPLPLPPPTPVRPTLESISPSFTRARRPSFMLSAHGRRESMVMDMDVLAESEAPTRVATPSIPLQGVFEDNGKNVADEGEVEKQPEAVVEPEKPKKMGNLMKELKQDVQQGAMEFDMDSFF